MSKKQFTPGPWEVSYGNEGSIFGDLDNSEHDGDYPYIGSVAGIKPAGAEHPECSANARIIAAAPEMYELLEKVLHTTTDVRLDKEIKELLNSITNG